MSQILVIDDEREVTTFFNYLLSRRGHQVETANQVKVAIHKLESTLFDLAMIDLKLGDADGLSLLEIVKQRQPSCKAIIMTSFSTIHTAVKAMQLGAYDYVEKPFEEIDKLEQLIDSALLNHQAENSFGELDAKALEVGCVIGNSEEMKRLYLIADKIAKKQIPILIIGETGTGKEVLAKFIHKMSTRSHEPFLGVNCGAIAETLLESELFGHEKGAFTGANQTRKGFFEIARNGTLFFDEIGEASLQTQVKLLRVLENHEFMRIGGEQVIQTNAKIISATNVDLEEACQKKNFRSDLLYRLDGVKLTIPPLRARKADIPLLINYFIQKIPDARNIAFSQQAIECLQDYDWPGNLRELMNVLTQTVALHDNDQSKIEEYHLPDKIKTFKKSTLINYSFNNEHFAAPLNNNVAIENEQVANQLSSEHSFENLIEFVFDSVSKSISHKINLKQGFDLLGFQSILRDYETKIIQEIIAEVLRNTLGNQKKAGQLLGIKTRTLRYLLNEKPRNMTKNDDDPISSIGD